MRRYRNFCAVKETISRVNRSLQFGAEGYELVLDALIAKDLKGKK